MDKVLAWDDIDADELFDTFEQIENRIAAKAKSSQAKSDLPTRLPLTMLHPYRGYKALKGDFPVRAQPFLIIDDDPDMIALIEQIKDVGILEPLVVRADPEGRYEILSGHRRYRIAQILNLSDVPIRVVDLDDDEAALAINYFNSKREKLRISEEALRLWTETEAIKRKPGRYKTGAQPEIIGKTNEVIARKYGYKSTKRVIQLLKIAKMMPELLDLLDTGKIPMAAGFELAFLSPVQQQMAYTYFQDASVFPNIRQAKLIRTAAEKGELKKESLQKIFEESEQAQKMQKVTSSQKNNIVNLVIRSFPAEMSINEIMDTLAEILEDLQK